MILGDFVVRDEMSETCQNNTSEQSENFKTERHEIWKK